MKNISAPFVASVSVFCEHANFRPATEQQQAALVQIVTLLENDPLALKWAAMHTAVTNPLSTRNLLEQNLSACPDARPALENIRQAALDCALAALPPSLRQFLRGVSVFVEGWSVDAAAVVCDAPQAGEWCEELLRRELVCCDTTRETSSYRLVEWVRLCLQAELGEDAFQRLQQAHKAYYFQMACDAAPHLRFTPDLQWLRQLEAETANLLAAFEESYALECIQFALALWRWGYACAHIHSTERMLLLAYFACRPLPSEFMPELCRALGSVSYRQQKHTTAKGYFVDAYHSACEQENWTEAAFSAQMLTTQAGKLGQLSDAYCWAETSIALWQKAKLPWGEACILNELGVIAWQKDHLTEAQELFHKSAHISKQIGDTRQYARVLNNVGLIAETRKEYQLAEKCYRQYLAEAVTWLDQRDACNCLNNFAVVCFKQQKLRQATALFARALAQMEAIGYTLSIPGTLAGLGQAAHAKGNDKFAAQCFGLATRLNANYMDEFNLSDRHEVEQTIGDVRGALRPQIYGRFFKKGQNMTLKSLLTSLDNLLHSA